MPLDALPVAAGAGIVITYGLVGIAAFAGRLNHTTDAAEYRSRMWPVAPILMTIATVVILVMRVIQAWVPMAVAVGPFLIGVVYYAICLRSKPDRWTLPAPADEELGEEVAA